MGSDRALEIAMGLLFFGQVIVQGLLSHMLSRRPVVILLAALGLGAVGVALTQIVR
jgi:hypothetical protein